MSLRLGPRHAFHPETLPGSVGKPGALMPLDVALGPIASLDDFLGPQLIVAPGDPAANVPLKAITNVYVPAASEPTGMVPEWYLNQPADQKVAVPVPEFPGGGPTSARLDQELVGAWVLQVILEDEDPTPPG